MALDIIDGAGNPKQLASVAVGSVHTPIHNVAQLPGTVETDTAASKGFLQTLAGIISGGRAAVDLASTPTANLATLAGAISAARMAVNVDSTTTGKLDSIITALGSYLATLAGTVSASRVAVDLTSTVTGYLQTLAGAVTAARVAVDLASTPTANLATLAGAISAARMAVNVDSTTTGKLDTVNANLAPTAAAINQTSSGTTQAAFGSQTCVLGFWAKNISTGTQKVYIFPGTATTANGYELAVGEERFFPGTQMSTYHHIATAAGANICWEAI